MQAIHQVLAVALAVAFSTTPIQAQDNVQQAKSFEKTITRKVGAQYLLFLPKGYDAQSEKRWPMIFFLHGAGERGANIWKVAVHGPPKIVRDKSDFPFIVVSPQCPDGEAWSNDVLLSLLDDATAHYAVDTNRVYLTGLSMGGFGSWSLGIQYPERFAAMAPICGGGELIHVLLASRAKAGALKSLGVWAFHGAKDPTVPLEESRRMVAALKKAGCADVKLTVYPEAQHDSWTESYNNPELYEWFLKHARGKQG
jgi:predicted peptidase